MRHMGEEIRRYFHLSLTIIQSNPSEEINSEVPQDSRERRHNQPRPAPNQDRTETRRR